ncbi:hypothetical protein TSUD_142280 [Trifolium subterraneum]|uniref:Uncharacterized protein n=1 Tax=Trifolium subterraneum TaxID=3900 RepID=A0A2Z6MV09_TRISU|nr:hypothetical protein TSUD_142280 [Trifolium subterraneum]
MLHFKRKLKGHFDNMSPKVTEFVIRTALNRFATVRSVKFIPNYMGPTSLPQCALVELDSAKQFPFMMSGMPRPS